MSYRDDFNSSMTSPGNYSPSSNYGGNNPSGQLGGNQGTFGGTNNYGSGYQTTSQVPKAISDAIAGNNSPGFVSYGPIPPALGPQGIPGQSVPAGYGGLLPPALTNAARYLNPFRWPTARRANVGGPSFPYNNGYNGRPAANYPPTPTWAGGPTYNANVGGLVGGSGGHAMGGGWNPNSGQFGGPR